MNPAAIATYTSGVLRARAAYAADPLAAENTRLQADREAAARRMRQARAKTKETP